MASGNYNERVEVVVARSRIGEALVVVGTLGTAALVAATPMDAAWHCAALAWIGVAGLRALRGLRPGVRLAVDVECEVEIGGVRGTLRDGSFVAPWLAIVRWRPAGAWWDRTRLVLPDMIAAEHFRRLRVLLRLGRMGA